EERCPGKARSLPADPAVDAPRARSLPHWGTERAANGSDHGDAAGPVRGAGDGISLRRQRRAERTLTSAHRASINATIMMQTARVGTMAFLLLSLACHERSDANAQAEPPIPERLMPAGAATTAHSDRIQPQIVHVPTPDTLRGLYVNRWAALGSKLKALIEVAKKTEVNALVIDVKDDRGFVLYRSSVPLAREIGADTADGHWMSASKL